MSIETYDLRKDRYFPGELVLTASQFEATITSLARNVLFLRGINASITVSTPMRMPCDDAFVTTASAAATGGVSAASQIDIRFDETGTAMVDTKSIGDAVDAVVGTNTIPSWQIRPVHLTALSQAIQRKQEEAQEEKRKSQQLNAAMVAKAASAAAAADEPVYGGGDEQQQQRNKTAAAVAAEQEAQRKQQQKQLESEPGIPCTVRLIILKVAIEGGSTGGAGGGNNSGGGAVNTSRSWLSSFGSSFTTPPKETVEEWCIPAVILHDSEAARLRRLVSQYLAHQRGAVGFHSSSLSSQTNSTSNASRAGGAFSFSGTGVGGAAPSSSSQQQQHHHHQFAHPSAAALASVFSVGSNMDDDDAIIITEADVREVTELSLALRKNDSNNSLTAAIGSMDDVACAFSSPLSACPSPAGGRTPTGKNATAAAIAAAIANGGGRSPNANNNNSGGNKPLASTTNAEALEMLCAMLEPDSPARLQRILMWMQSAVLENTAHQGHHGHGTTSHSSGSSPMGRKSSSGGPTTNSIFETAPRVSVAVAMTSFGPMDGRLVEPRPGSLQPPGSAAGGGRSGSAGNNNNNNTSMASSSSAGSPNGGTFRGFSLPALW